MPFKFGVSRIGHRFQFGQSKNRQNDSNDSELPQARQPDVELFAFAMDAYVCKWLRPRFSRNTDREIHTYAHSAFSQTDSSLDEVVAQKQLEISIEAAFWPEREWSRVKSAKKVSLPSDGPSSEISEGFAP